MIHGKISQKQTGNTVIALTLTIGGIALAQTI
jgi:hypothetical protein